MKWNKTMKNKYFSFVALAAAALATSCASDDLAEQKQEQTTTHTVTLTASVNEGQTRVGMTKDENNTASFYWHKDDKILVQTVDNGSYSGAEFSIKDGDAKKDGATSATFTGSVASGSEVGTYAVYPYSENQKHSFTSNKEKELTYVFPASYKYDKVESNIFSKTTTTDGSSTTSYPSNPTNMPMLGTITDDNGSKKISFKCLGGLAVIRIASMPVAEGTLTVTADQQLSGNFTVKDLSADEAKIETQDATTNNTVSFTFSGATANGIGVFYLPLGTGDYTNVTVTIGETKVECGSVTISRAGVTAISIAKYSGTATTYKDQLLRSYGSNRYYLGNNIYLINDHEFVDLGLSSGLLWATKNIGADSEADYGDFYSWGETATKTDYSSDNYNYKDNPTTLPAANDAAYVNWGSSCRMPTNAEFGELIDNCEWDWTTESSINGCKGTSTKQGYINNSIFLPAAGSKGGSGHVGKGNYGCYWSSSLSDESGSAYYLYFNSTACRNNNKSSRWISLTIRAVADKPTTLE